RLPFPSKSNRRDTRRLGRASALPLSFDSGFYGGLIGGAIAGAVIGVLSYPVVGGTALSAFNYGALVGCVFGAATQLSAPRSGRSSPKYPSMSRREWIGPLLACAAAGVPVGAFMGLLFW